MPSWKKTAKTTPAYFINPIFVGLMIDFFCFLLGVFLFLLHKLNFQINFVLKILFIHQSSYPVIYLMPNEYSILGPYSTFWDKYQAYNIFNIFFGIGWSF